MMKPYTGKRFDQAQRDARKAAVKAVTDNPGNENSVPQLRARIEKLEQAVGLRPASK